MKFCDHFIVTIFQFTSLLKEIDDLKEDIKKSHTENTKLNNVIRNLEKDIAGLKKEIQERDETIQDKVCRPTCVPVTVNLYKTLNPTERCHKCGFR